jgi:hypothetical protein
MMMKMSVVIFWVVMTCDIVFRRMCCLHLETLHPVSGVDTFLRNVCNHLQSHTALHNEECLHLPIIIRMIK